MLQVRSITLQFGARVVLDCVSLQVQAGEIVAVLGESGSGKTTLLRVIAGLETPSAGTVWLAGANLSATPVHQRSIGMVFQDNQLFPHLTVAENVAYALRVQGVAAAQRQQRVRAMLELVGLPDFEERAVGQLSGGEAKRVAVARALVAAPQVLLLDEPLSGLDSALHARLLADFSALLRARGTTTLHVTHNRAEAEAIADRVVEISSLSNNQP
jgi:thiamine transport system ATP-binding protein